MSRMLVEGRSAKSADRNDLRVIGSRFRSGKGWQQVAMGWRIAVSATAVSHPAPLETYIADYVKQHDVPRFSSWHHVLCDWRRSAAGEDRHYQPPFTVGGSASWNLESKP